MTRELICIACPVGCRLTAVINTDNTVVITGNQCERGETYGQAEVLAPKRTVTAVVKTNSKQLSHLPVKTTQPLLKQYIPSLLTTLYHCYVIVPVAAGDILLADFEGTGVDVVFTRSLEF